MSTEALLGTVAGLVLLAKVGGILTARVGQPPVLGELVTGVLVSTAMTALFGTAGGSLVHDEPALYVLAEIGVLLLLFDVGLEVDLRAFKRVGASALLVAVIGVLVPFALGWGASRWLLPDSPDLVHVFVGASLTATSVGITARVLKDLGAAQRPEAQTVLGAALVDDVLGLVVLAVVTGSVTAASGGGQIAWLAIAGIVVKAIVFLAFAVVAGHLASNALVRLVGLSGERGLIVVVGLALCFALAFVAKAIGLAGIVGAFAAGLVLDPYGVGVRARPDEETLNELLHPLNHVFVPLFFVLMGLHVDVAALLEPRAIALGSVLLVAAVVGKLACAAGVLGHGMDRLAVAIGMIPRGEVGLIFAGIGAGLRLNDQPIVDSTLFSAIVVMVLATTLLTPPALRWRFGRATGGAVNVTRRR